MSHYDSLHVRNCLQQLPKNVSRLDLFKLIESVVTNHKLNKEIVSSDLATIPPHISTLLIPARLFKAKWNPTLEKYDDKGPSSLATILSQTPRTITEIDLSNPNDPSFNYRQMKTHLLAFLWNLPTHIVKITLAHFSLGIHSWQIDWDEFFKAIPSTVIELDISMNGLGALNQDELKRCLKQLPPHLKKINLSYNGLEKITKKEWIELLIALPNSIEEIVVEEKEGQEILATLLPQVRHIKLKTNLDVEHFPLHGISALTDLITAYDEDHVFYKKPKPEKEIEAIIQEALLPLTKEYLYYLSKKLGIHFNSPSFWYEEQFASWEENEDTKKIIDKWRIVRQMYDALNKTCFPSECLSEFTQILADKHHQEQLATHRNPKWQQYLKNVLVVIAITLSGIIPGLLALFAYSHFNNRTSPTFFTKAVGEEYKDKVQEIALQCPAC